MAAKASVGTFLSIVLGVPTTYDDNATTGFPSLTYAEIGEISDLGEFGGSSEVLTHTPLKTGIIDKAIGPTNYGTIAAQFAKLFGDAGQDALKSAFDGANRDKNHSFKVTYPDGGAEYFTGKAASFTSNVGSASNIRMGASNIELTNKVIVVDPA